MNRLMLTFAITITAGIVALEPAVAQVLPPLKKADRVEISNGPELESATDDLTIIRWTTNNPGGSDVHYGIVHYGTDPKDLSQTAKNPIRLNHGHASTTFRVRLYDLRPQTIYYYRVSSEQSSGMTDGVKSTIRQFITPRLGERIVTELKPSIDTDVMRSEVTAVKRAPRP